MGACIYVCAEKDDLDWRMELESPVRWSKYLTAVCVDCPQSLVEYHANGSVHKEGINKGRFAPLDFKTCAFLGSISQKLIFIVLLFRRSFLH